MSTGTGEIVMTAPLRFYDKVMPEPMSGCWLWMASLDHGGYARYRHNGKSYIAHRASYEMHVGPIPPGLDIDHKCRVRSCVNPDHLEPVTRSENLGRSSLMGRSINHRNSQKTHCKHGHPFNEENTVIITATGGRRCKECHRIEALRYYHDH